MILGNLVCIAQNNSRFHHIIDQDLINQAHFTLVKRKGNSNQIMQITKPLFAVVTLDKGKPTLDVWRIYDHKSDPKLDEFGNVKDSTSNIINAATPFSSSTLYLTDNRILLGDPTRVIKIPFKAFTWSVGTTPFRYRFRTDSSIAILSSNLSISFSYGFMWGKTTFTSRLTRHNANIIAPFIGLGTADLKLATVKNPTRWKNEKTTDRTNPALSFGIGYTKSINNLGIVFSIGSDLSLGPNSSKWSYQGRPWLGLGINTSLGAFK